MGLFGGKQNQDKTIDDVVRAAKGKHVQVEIQPDGGSDGDNGLGLAQTYSRAAYVVDGRQIYYENYDRALMDSLINLVAHKRKPAYNEISPFFADLERIAKAASSINLVIVRSERVIKDREFYMMAAVAKVDIKAEYMERCHLIYSDTVQDY